MSNKKKDNSVIKAFRKANREIELERNGYAHPWVTKTVVWKNKKKYDRKQNKKDTKNMVSFLFILKPRHSYFRFV